MWLWGLAVSVLITIASWGMSIAIFFNGGELGAMVPSLAISFVALMVSLALLIWGVTYRRDRIREGQNR